MLATLLIVVSAGDLPPELYPDDTPQIVPVWNRVADWSPRLRSVEAAELSPDGRLAVSGGKFGSAVMMWRAADGHLLWEVAHESEVECVCWSPDGRRVATGGEDYTVRVWDAKTGGSLAVVELPRGPDGIAWSPDGRTIAAGGEDGVLTLIDPETYKTGRSVKLGSAINSLVFCDGGRRIIAAGNTQTPRPDGGTDYAGFCVEIDAESLETVREYGPFAGSVKSVRVSPEGRLVATTGFGRHLRVFAREDGSQVADVDLGERAEAVAWTPDGSFLAAGGHFKAVRFYRTSDWSLAHEEPCPRTEYIHFSRDGRLMLSAHEDGGLLSLRMLLSDLQANQAVYQRMSAEQLNNRDLRGAPAGGTSP